MTRRAPFHALPDRLLSTCCRVWTCVALTGVIVASLPSITMATNTVSGHRERLIRGVPLNVRVSHDRYPDHAEPYLAVNPRHPNNLLGAAQLLDRAAVPVAGTFTSFDGGRTWHDNGPLPSVAAHTASLDVTVAFDAAGGGFVAALVNSISGGRYGTDTRIVVWRSDNGGLSFHRPVTIAHGQELDHPWLAADPSGRDLYLVWSDKVRNSLDFSRSLNSGRTFSRARLLYQARGIRPMVGDPVVSAGRNGLVGIAFYERSGGAPAAIRVMTSLNHGHSFRAPRTLPRPTGMIAFYGGRQQPSTGVSIAIDPRSDMLDVAYAAYRPFTTHTDILLSRSADGGKTWTRPVRVNRDPETDNTINHQPQVAIDPRGNVFVSYFALAYGRIDVFLGESTSGGSSFQRPIRVTTRSFDPRLGITAYRNGMWWIGDYQGLAAGPHTIYPFWNDTRTGRLQIFAAAVSVTRSMVPTVRAMTRFAGTHPNVQVSRGRYPEYAEPDVAVNPRNPRNLLGAAQCIGGSPLRRVPCTFVSFDAGRTWRENGPLPRRHGDAEGVDVSVAYDAHGVAFVASMLSPNSGADSVAVWRSADGGRHFSRPVTVYHGHTLDWGADHPWLAVDTTHGRHAGWVYVVWMEGHRQSWTSRLLLSRSVNGGRTFTRPRPIGIEAHGQPGVPVMAVDARGIIHVVYTLARAGVSPLHPPLTALPHEIVSSFNGGQTFGPPHRLGAAPFGLQLPSLQTANIPAVATDPRDGTVYVALAAYRAGTHHTDIVLWHAPAGGQVWRGPVRVDDGSHATGGDDFQPRVVATSHGSVYVSYFRLAHGRVNVFLSRSTDRGARFEKAVRVTSVSFDPALSQPGTSPWLGDYQGLAAGPRMIYPFWNDTRTGHMELFTSAVPGT